MKNNFKSGLLFLALTCITFAANATTYTAVANGNFFSSATWGGTAPTGNITSGDNVLIATGVVVTLDDDVTFNSPLGYFTVNGTLSGTHNLNIQNGSLSGAGTLAIHDLTFGVTGASAFTGTTSVSNLYNSMSLLSLTSNTQVLDTLALLAGTAQIGAATTLTFANNAVIKINGGIYSAAGTGVASLMGSVTLLYTGTGTVATGAEVALTNINAMVVNLSSSSNQLTLSTDATITGQLNVMSGSLNINGHTLTLNGTVATSATGSLTGSNLSNLTLGGGAGSMGMLIFTSGSSMLNNLTVNGAASSYASLGSDLTVSGILTLTSGGINLTGSSDLILTGLDSIHGGSATSYVSTSGTGSLMANISSVITANSRMLQIGTPSAYAPVRVTNNSNASGNFSANAHSGVFANGTTGTDLSSTMSSVNTSWNVESDITTGANVTLEAYWNTAMEVNSFVRSNVRLSHYINSAWDDSASAQATVHAGGMASVSRSGIRSFSPFAVFSGPALGVNDINATAAFATYPNPAINTLTVSITDPKTTDEVKVYDMIGNHIATYPMHNTNTIDIANLTAGVYFLSVNNTRTQKFVKQ